MKSDYSPTIFNQRFEPKDGLDDFPTPPWATRAVCEELVRLGFPLSEMLAWDPCCNRGYMVAPMREYFASVFASDIHDYGWQGMDAQADFLMDWGGDAPDVDFIFMNFPFRLGLEFILQGLSLARVGVAVFARTNFLEGQTRYRELFSKTPEAYYLPFVERVVIWKGVLLDPEVKVANWKPKKNAYVIEKPTTATSYSWLIFKKGHNGVTELRRIAPCRAALTRANDYPDLPPHLDPALVVRKPDFSATEAYKEASGI